MGEVGSSAFDEGVRLLNEKQFGDAILSLQRALETDPSNVQVHAYLGVAYSQLKQHASAVAEFEKLTVMDPGNASYKFNLGKAYEAWGKESEALAAYQEVLKINPGHQMARTAVTALNGKQTPAAAAATAQTVSRPAAPAQQSDGDLSQATPWNSGNNNQQTYSQPSAPGAYGQSRSYQPRVQPGPATYLPGQIPPEIKGKLNWGAFLLGPLWSIAHRTWIGLLCLAPYIGFIMSLVLLVKGNDWGWQNRQFSSVEEFKQVQSAWVKWGVGLIVFVFLLAIVAAIVFPVLMKMSGTVPQGMPAPTPGVPAPSVP